MDPQKKHAPVCRNQVLSPPKQSLSHIACQTTLIAPDSDSSGSCNTQMADTDGRHGAVRPVPLSPVAEQLPRAHTANTAQSGAPVTKYHSHVVCIFVCAYAGTCSESTVKQSTIARCIGRLRSVSQVVLSRYRIILNVFLTC